VAYLEQQRKGKQGMTQLEILADAFDRGEHLTVATALSLYGIYALSQRCGELERKWGYPVQSKTITTPLFLSRVC